MRPAAPVSTVICLLTLAACADGPTAMRTPAEQREMNNEMTGMNQMATGQIPAADGDNMLQ